jgi:tetratricopeptide (TPR) repeat protein
MMPASAEVPLNRGNVLFELKRYPEALASYEAALARDAKHL